MTEAIAEQKIFRTSARKVRLLANAMRKMLPSEALKRLQFTRKGPAEVLYKVLKQAVANATTVKKLNNDNLRFKSIEIGEGPTLKRWRATSRGRGVRILKRTSHIRIVLEG